MSNHIVFIFGQANTGKKTLIKLIKDADPSEAGASLADRINRMILNDMQFVTWDLSDLFVLKDIWDKESENIKILLFLLDTSDQDRFSEVKKKFYHVIFELDSKNRPLVFCFHKMDLEDAEKNYVKARDLFELQKITKNKVYKLQTSINNPEDIDLLRNQLVEIIESSRW
ncbi:MAG: ADP-ribosylation factor-like protein [Candidatus Hermodarchaeota archaeon]